MARPKKYTNNAEKQRAFAARRKEELLRLRQQLGTAVPPAPIKDEGGEQEFTAPDITEMLVQLGSYVDTLSEIHLGVTIDQMFQILSTMLASVLREVFGAEFDPAQNQYDIGHHDKKLKAGQIATIKRLMAEREKALAPKPTLVNKELPAYTYPLVFPPGVLVHAWKSATSAEVSAWVKGKTTDLTDGKTACGLTDDGVIKISSNNNCVDCLKCRAIITEKAEALRLAIAKHENPPQVKAARLVHAYREGNDIRSLCGNVYVKGAGQGYGTDNPEEVTCQRCIKKLALNRQVTKSPAPVTQERANPWNGFHPVPLGDDALTEKDPAMKLVFELRKKKEREAKRLEREQAEAKRHLT